MIEEDDTHPLVLALDAARLHDYVATLDALLEAWRDLPAPRIADLIDVVGQTVATPTPPELYGDSVEAEHKWNDLHARNVDVPARLTTLTSTSVGLAIQRLAKLPDDPRVDAAIVRWCERADFTGKASLGWYRALLGHLERVRDPRQRAAIRKLAQTFGLASRSDAAHALREHLVAIANALDDKLAAPIETPAIVGELESVLATLGWQPPDTRADDLLMAVYDNPDDDGSRMVYADALLERQDPRGELIVMQLRGSATTAKEKKLVAGLRKQVLGELAEVITLPVIERGFLARCTVDPRMVPLATLRRLAGHPAWATVRELEGSAIIGLDPVMRGLRTYGFTATVAGNVEQWPAAPEELLAGRERPIVELRYSNRAAGTGDLALLATCKALPRLRRLVMRRPAFAAGGQFNPGDAASIPIWLEHMAAAPVLDRVERILLDVTFPRRLDGFRPLFDAGRARIIQIGIGVLELVIERGTRDYERASLTIGPIAAHHAAYYAIDIDRVFATLPTHVRDIRIVPRRPADREVAEQLRAVAARRPSVRATVEL